MELVRPTVPPNQPLASSRGQSDNVVGTVAALTLLNVSL